MPDGADKNVGAPLAAACLALTLLAAGGLARAADPGWYVPKSTWQDTILASLTAVAESGAEDGFAPLETETMRGGEPARWVNVRVAGAKEMYLFVTGCPDVKWGVADWAEAKLVRKDGSVEWLSESKNFKVLLGRHELDMTLRSGLYQKMRITDRLFERGLNVQANSALLVPLDGEYERFEAWIGVDAWAGTNGSVRFSVLGSRSNSRRGIFRKARRASR